MGESISCPYYSLVSDNLRKRLLENTNKLRRDLATGEYSLPAAKQMNELAWNCETEYNLKKIQEQILKTNSTVRYKNFGVNTLEQMSAACDLQMMGYMPVEWTMGEDSLSPSLIYNGTADTFHVSNLYKWNATELACTYGTYANENLVLLICAYNVKGAVIGETIYEKSENGKYVCDDGAKCGTDGTCNEKLCRVPILSPDSLLPIYSPTLFCPSLSFMNQFSRYYALNMHNSYRRLVATGWAENKLTSYAPRAARMEILSYDCRLEEAASETVSKCEKQPASKNSEDTGSNVQIIGDVNISKEAAIESAISTWFSQLQTYGMDPNSTWTENPTVMNCANVMHDKYETVGCAVNTCSTKGFTVVECRYGPKRLQQGNLVYDVGTPCSRCTQDKKCVFGALCQ